MNFQPWLNALCLRDGNRSNGKPKTFRNSMLGNVREFVERFKSISIGSSEQLNGLVQQAENALCGVDPAALRDSDSLRSLVASQFGAIGEQLTAATVERPTRRIRTATPAEAVPVENAEPSAPGVREPAQRIIRTASSHLLGFVQIRRSSPTCHPMTVLWTAQDFDEWRDV